jgi:hypothetical protein
MAETRRYVFFAAYGTGGKSAAEKMVKAKSMFGSFHHISGSFKSSITWDHSSEDQSKTLCLAYSEKQGGTGK